MLEEELRTREKRWSASIARLRDRVAGLEKQNQELREEITNLERYRLKNWQSREFSCHQQKHCNDRILKRKVKTYDQNRK